MKRPDRRDLLRFGAASLALGGFGTTALRGTGHAALPAGQRKMLMIFLRGGNDALNSIVPVGDPQYFGARGTAAISTSRALDLGNGWAAFHPSLAELHELHELGEVASIHRVGYPDANLSHFRSWRYIETARIGDTLADDGLVARWAATESPGSLFPAVCVSREIQRAFKGFPAMPHVPDLEAFTFPGDAAGTKLREGIRTAHSRGSGPVRDRVNASGHMMLDTLELLQGLPPHDPPPEWYPTESGLLAAEGLRTDAWVRTFFQELRDAVRLLKQTEARVAGVEIPNWDMHAKLGHHLGKHAGHLAVLARAVRSVRLDTLSDLWDDLAVVVVSEFGRASALNASGGTDHGKAGAMWVAGGNVQGGVYNCDPTTWPAGQTLFSENDKWVSHLTDYRAVLGELFQEHMQSSPATLEATFPGWSTFQGPEHAFLGVVA